MFLFHKFQGTATSPPRHPMGRWRPSSMPSLEFHWCCSACPTSEILWPVHSGECAPTILPLNSSGHLNLVNLEFMSSVANPIRDRMDVLPDPDQLCALNHPPWTRTIIPPTHTRYPSPPWRNYYTPSSQPSDTLVELSPVLLQDGND